jgi:prephenate dehydrogenase
MDVTSLKAAPVAAMLAATARSGAGVVGTHPMFGPGVHTLQGQRVVLCRARGDAWFAWAARRSRRAASRDRGHARPARPGDGGGAGAHALPDAGVRARARAAGTRLGMSLDETLGLTSPAYLLELFVAARHFAQSPALYGPIEMRNPRRPR